MGGSRIARSTSRRARSRSSTSARSCRCSTRRVIDRRIGDLALRGRPAAGDPGCQVLHRAPRGGARPGPRPARAVPGDRLPGAGCGWRGGEIFGLERDALDLDVREVHVRHQLTVISGRTPYLAPPKTKTSLRTNELSTAVVTALRAHLATFPVRPENIEDETDPRARVVRSARLVFTRGDGRPIHRADWSHIWRPAVQAAGLPPGYGLRDLRHYFATVLDLRRRQRQDRAARHGAHHADGHAQHLRRVLAGRRRPDPDPRGLRTRLYRRCTRRGCLRRSRRSAPVR